MALRPSFSMPAGRDRWYPMFIRSSRDIERLNRLFEKGWYLDDMGLEDMPFLAFKAPLPDPDAPTEHEAPEPSPDDDVLMLVLSRGNGKIRQRAMLVEPDERGYRDLSSVTARIDAEGGGWHFWTAIGIERRNFLVILGKMSDNE